MFFMKILPKFQEKTLARLGDIKISLAGRRMYTYALSPFMDIMLSKERQVLKWVGIFQVGIFLGDFPGRSLMGVNFPSGNFPGANFPRTLIYKLFFQKHSPRSAL